MFQKMSGKNVRIAPKNLGKNLSR